MGQAAATLLRGWARLSRCIMKVSGHGHAPSGVGRVGCHCIMRVRVLHLSAVTTLLRGWVRSGRRRLGLRPGPHSVEGWVGSGAVV